jgi:hypothetical protein
MAPEAEQGAEAKLAAAVYEDAEKPRNKKASRSEKSEKSDKAEKSSKSTKTANKSERRRSKREVASYEERGIRSYRSVEREDRPRVAYSERSYGGGNGYSEGGRSAGQTMSDNLRPL